MFYGHNKTFWYQFCNFKHFLKAENSEDSLASSCEEFCISFRVTQYETGLLLELGMCHVSCVWGRELSSLIYLPNTKQLNETELPTLPDPAGDSLKIN